MNDDVTTREQAATERGTIEQQQQQQQMSMPVNDVRDTERTTREARDTRTDAGTTQGDTTTGTDDGFLDPGQMQSLRTQWDNVQTAFVDDPRSAVSQAHNLVASMVDQLTQTFTRERDTLEGQWNGSGQADTEALRVAMQRYRSFFNRLLGT